MPRRRNPVQGAVKMLQVRVPEDMHRKLKAHAALQGRSLQDILREVAQAYLAASRAGTDPRQRTE